ncbi:MAG TPA: hypothetical protein VK851_13520, partial [Anaerolineales bacterium]|nr:hypothetical protein [Anaerolineales bacterium]
REVFATDYVVYDAIKTLDPIAEGFAETISQEGCVDSNGKRFSYVVGIWFYIDNKVVEDFKDYENLGSWIIAVMNLLDTIPRDEYTMYAEPTNTIFTFVSNSKSLKVVVPIKKYWAEADGKNGTEVFLMFYSNP